MHRPSGDSIDARLKLMVTSGVSITFTPPASATVQSPDHSARQAASSATSADEQAVSMATLGPRRSKRCEIRLAAMLSAPPVPVWTSMPVGPSFWIAW